MNARSLFTRGSFTGGKSSERALSGNEEECLTFHSFPLINLHDSPLFLPLCAPYVNGSLPLSTSEVEDLI